MRQRQDSRGRYRARGIHAHAAVQPKTTAVQWADPDVGNQEAIFWRGPYPTCASGGFGAAKTTAFILKILYLSETFPGYRTLVYRKVWEELKHSTMKSFFSICPAASYKFGKRADTEKILQLNPVMCDDGVERASEVLWFHLDSVDEKVLRGIEMNSAFGDQAEETDEDAYDLVDSRLGRWMGAHVPLAVLEAYRRDSGGQEWPWWNTASGKPEPGAKPIPPSFHMLAVNPDTFLHWIYRRFHEDSPDHVLKHIPDDETGELVSYKDLGYRMFHMDSLNNRFLSKQNRQKLLSKPKEWRDRFVHGKWGMPEGVIHRITDASFIPADPEFIDYMLRTSELHRVLDHGEAAPTACGWFAVDTDGNSIAYREYYEPGKLIRDHRREITRLSGKTRGHAGEEYASDLADPSMFVKDAQVKGGKFSLADEYKDDESPYSDFDAIYWSRADNNELVTRDRINDYLAIDPERIHPYRWFLYRRAHPGANIAQAPDSVKGAPRLFFIRKTAAYPYGCDYAIRETQSQRRIKIGVDGHGQATFSDDRAKGISDHAYDFVRYHVASRPAAAIEPEKSHPSGTLAEVMAAHRAAKQERGIAARPGERLRSRWR